MKQGRVYMRQAGTSGEWRDVGSAAGFSVALEVNEPVKPILTGGFTFSTKDWDPEVLKLYYGADFVKFAGANNRGETRKEEKHMGVREFKSGPSDSGLRIESDMVGGTEGGSGVYMKMIEDAFGWFEKADVPLIAHALFEKSGWPDAEKGAGDRWRAFTPAGSECIAAKVVNQGGADATLAKVVANLAAYREWVAGKAEREAAEASKEAEAARKREHDELRTSAIALEALAIYNKFMRKSYSTWDATMNGCGVDDMKVRYYIKEAEAARAAKPAPKIGDRVRVSADAKTAEGGPVCFDAEVEGVVESSQGRNLEVVAPTGRRPEGLWQLVGPKYVTVLATAEQLEAEKAKAERDAGIDALRKALRVGRPSAVTYYDRGVRATA